MLLAVIGVDRIYGARDAQTAVGITEPGSAFRSAGPDSAIAWEGLGVHGRGFVGGGPDAAEIEEVTGRAAKTPVRI
ncbi:alpha/beta-hydrolase N-terminal domain-containing protein [Paeniglutamicibacter cryotolerans]|uniref:Putative membrane protein n=1 Tax=Paeniglutamicibacter cryotolerans TaxID=670079 RepID=A0A839QQM5_9MICC|nr:alpha/beta-hydrolase N-terminal domain-containing protein [Paeniglutamicibacter cryotolerans]MBB2996945.1 putative membrane protein [Paeniglutamicibacter cryotolerans]